MRVHFIPPTHTASLLRFSKSFFVFSLLIISLSPRLLAEGSRDLYPDGATGYRAYLMSSTTSQNWNPFATPGTMWVWVKPGETIYAGSSVHGFRRASNNNTPLGEIVLRSPNGNEYRSLNATHNPTDGGLIQNRAQELAGPQTASNPDGYEPFTHEVLDDEGGIWEVNFISLGTNTNIPSAGVMAHPSGTWNGITYDENTYDGNYPANANWVQPLQYGTNPDNAVALIAAWDVSVGSAPDPSDIIPGRLFTTVFAGTLPNGRFQEKAFYGKFYVLTPGGYAFLVDNNGQGGASFNFFSNDKGIHVNGNPNQPSYQSLQGSNLADVTGRTRDPRTPDATPLGSANVTNKLFYNKPAADLPASASIRYQHGNVVSTTTWLKNPAVIPPAITNLNLACGGTITFNSNVSGGYKVMIDINNNGNFNDEEDRVLTGQVTGGTPVAIAWDGLDGNGQVVDEDITIKIQVVVTAGEIHFPFADVEANWDGIIIGQLKADGTYEPTGNYTVYWDDSNLGNTPNNTIPSDPRFNNADGLDSRVNGHKWGGNVNETSDQSYYGNNRVMDTWSYVTGLSEAKSIVTCGLSLSGYVFNDVDGMEDGKVDNNNGADPYPLTSGVLHATLLNGSTVVATIPIGPEGEYQFGSLLANTTYTVVISETPNSTTSSLPMPWNNTGEFVGTTNGSDGSPNGILNVPIAQSSVSNANFGIQYKISIEGNVWHDPDGDAVHDVGEKPVSGSNDNNGDASSVTDGTVYANLVNTNAGNIVVARVQVAANGTYRFENVGAATGYQVILTQDEKALGSELLVTGASIPQGWLATGTNTLESGSPVPNTANKTNAIDLGVVTADVSEVNFAIQQPPVTHDSHYQLDYQPFSGQVIPLNGTAAATGDKGETEAETPIASDPENTTLSLVITSPIAPTGGTATGGVPVLYYGGVEVTETNFPGFRINNYDHDLFSVELNGIGYKGITFDFQVTDAAGAQSNISTYTIQFPRELPVKWESIAVREENKNAVLTWVTTEELNVSHFEVQYSSDAQMWRPVASVQAANRERASYSYTHELRRNGVHYFRVRNVDLDGSSSFSPVVSMKGGLVSEIRIYPNPVTDGKLTLDIPNEGVEQIRVYNITGTEIRNFSLEGNELNVRGLLPGQYIIRVETSEGGSATKTFLVK